MKKYYFALVLTLFILPIFGQNIPSYLPKDGLVGYWPFNGNANDESGNGNHGTVNGATLTTDRNGAVNSAYNFTRIKANYIQTTSSDILSPGNSEDYSFSLWFKSKNSQTIGQRLIQIIDRDFTSSSNYNVWLESNKILFQNYPNGDITNKSFIANNEWTHCVVVTNQKSKSVSIYKNGDFWFDCPLGNVPTKTSCRILIGCSANKSIEHTFEGSLDDIAVYNRALNIQEINSLYTGNVNAEIPSFVPKDGLVGWWPFNENANDESGNGIHGKVYGATLTADRTGKANSAYSFSRLSTNYIQTAASHLLSPGNSEDYSFSMWFKSKNSQTIAQRLIQIIDSNFTNSSNYNVWIESNKLLFQNYPKGGIIEKIFTANDEWIHCVSVINQKLNTVKIYKNGVFWFDGPLGSVPIKTSCRILFGCSANKTVEHSFDGALDDIAIFNRALTDNEITTLYGCNHQAATLTNANSVYLTTDNPVDIVATPSGGTFSGSAVKQGKFEPSSAKIGLNKVVYNYKNSTGCEDVTEFKLVVADTNGTICKFTDTVKVTKIETKYDTITVTNTITKYDTVIVKNNVFDTIIVNQTKYDTITLTDTVSILKIKFKLTTGLQANQLASMSLYPNPTSDVLHIEIGDAKALEGYRYRILDALGKEVYNELVKNAITEIPLKTLGAAGMYQLEVLDANNTSIQSNKIVLQ